MQERINAAEVTARTGVLGRALTRAPKMYESLVTAKELGHLRVQVSVLPGQQLRCAVANGYVRVKTATLRRQIRFLPQSFFELCFSPSGIAFSQSICESLLAKALGETETPERTPSTPSVLLQDLSPPQVSRRRGTVQRCPVLIIGIRPPWIAPWEL